jgi:hypothetical protein
MATPCKGSWNFARWMGAALAGMALVTIPLLGGCGQPRAEPPQGPAAALKGERSLFDGKTLKGWNRSDYPGQGQVKVQNGQILLEVGDSPLTGVTWAGGPLPKVDYEIMLEAMRVDGGDFFCGLTFPVKDSFCSFIVGGWGGQVVGLSCLNYMDAANNETTRVMPFENGRWYRLRVRVTEPKIEAWIDDEQVVNSSIEGRKVSVRFDVEPSCPLGVAAYRTKAALRYLYVRPITE